MPYQAPLPDLVLKAIVALVLLLFLGGLVVSAMRKSGLLIAGAAFIGFVAYRNTTIMNSYYMWYLPPFTALLFIVAGYGLSELVAQGAAAGNRAWDDPGALLRASPSFLDATGSRKCRKQSR